MSHRFPGSSKNAKALSFLTGRTCDETRRYVSMLILVKSKLKLDGKFKDNTTTA
jgi:hypothetical protein